MLLGILVFFFVIVCIFLTLLILIQSDKGGGISGAIGGGLGGASSLLGTQDTANILTRGTAIFGGLFLVLCIVMSAVVSHDSVSTTKSLLQKRAEKQQSYSPASVLGNRGLPMQQKGMATAPNNASAPGAPVGRVSGMPGVTTAPGAPSPATPAPVQEPAK